ncbi:unnamed protein product [Ostreobium quekettii]|uniref:peptidylprolyl isomerase n=1 Tax=Ostreobium quekettii TaxID=121088 RepID=A0A8S1IMU0_9CHLO|nr:unnamed protein product [Ostreobium quekettii]
MAIWIGRGVALPLLVLCAFATRAAGEEKDAEKLQIGVKYRPEDCTIKAAVGDSVHVHYKGTLTDGTEFDSSYSRGDPLVFTLGKGQVIKGWDQGILGMCPGEKRKLKIPASLGYGEAGAPPKVPGGATLIFHTELVMIGNK